MKLVFALDGGGTNCRAAVANAGREILGSGEAGPANSSTDPNLAARNILASARQALDDGGLADRDLAAIPAFLALAGENVSREESPLAGRLPFREMHVEDDSRVALQGGLGDDDGIVAIVGTGTAYIARRNAEIRRIGGWGFSVGDQGSGADLGRALLRETLLAHDGIRAHTRLTRETLNAFDDDAGRLSAYAQSELPSGFARFAPRIVQAADSGDPVAVALIAEGVRHVENALDALIWPACAKIALSGGLRDAYAARLGVRFRDRLVPSAADPLAGAVELAVRRFLDTPGAQN